jgi:hypothetical protein
MVTGVKMKWVVVLSDESGGERSGEDKEKRERKKSQATTGNQALL